MRGQGHQIFVDELTRFAARATDQRVKARLEAIAGRTAQPLRVAVRGRRGVGCSTVARALNRAGTASGIQVMPPTRCADPKADVTVYVAVEVVKPEDSEVLDGIAAAGQPVVAVLNKADLTGFSGAGPIAAARARCGALSALAGVPVQPMIGLLAVAAVDDIDESLWDGLRRLADHPDGSACLDGSFDGFSAAQLPVQTEVRLRLLNTLDLFGIALGVAALRRGGSAASVRALFRHVSGVDAIVDKVVAAGAEARYRRVLEAVAELEALAVTDKRTDEFLSRDDTVLARMAAALDVATASGLELNPADGPSEHLRRAVRAQRYSLEYSDLHRACGADIARGSLRLWSRVGESGETL